MPYTCMALLHTVCTATNTYRYHTRVSFPPAHAQVELNFEPLVSVASMLYGASFVAERYSGLRTFLEGGKREATGKEQQELAVVKKRKLAGQGLQLTAVPLSPSSDAASDSEVGVGVGVGVGVTWASLLTPGPF